MPGPATNIANAINAYTSAAKGGPTGGMAVKEPKADEPFADLVKSAIKEAVRIGRTAERQTIAGINDRADLNQVVTSVAEAEATLQTVVAVRDKVIDAYREIIRMPI